MTVATATKPATAPRKRRTRKVTVKPVAKKTATPKAVRQQHHADQVLLS